MGTQRSSRSDSRFLPFDELLESYVAFLGTVSACLIGDERHIPIMKILGGNKGALRVPILSFQYLRRPGRTSKLLCFHTVGSFESHRLPQLFLGESGRTHEFWFAALTCVSYLSSRACGPRNCMKITPKSDRNGPERRGRYHRGQVEAIYLSDPERA
jgi:hypothetical protein